MEQSALHRASTGFAQSDSDRTKTLIFPVSQSALSSRFLGLLQTEDHCTHTHTHKATTGEVAFFLPGCCCVCHGELFDLEAGFGSMGGQCRGSGCIEESGRRELSPEFICRFAAKLHSRASPLRSC